jgi:TctA family transporter
MPHEKLVRIISCFWLIALFPVAVAFTAGSLGHSFVLGIKTFLLIEFGMAVLSPLLGAVLGDSGRSDHRRKKR